MELEFAALDDALSSIDTFELEQDYSAAGSGGPRGPSRPCRTLSRFEGDTVELNRGSRFFDGGYRRVYCLRRSFQDGRVSCRMRSYDRSHQTISVQRLGAVSTPIAGDTGRGVPLDDGSG